jgi:hypothetical protein
MPRRSAAAWKAGAIAGVVATLALAAVSVVHFREKPPPVPGLMRFEMVTPDKATVQKDVTHTPSFKIGVPVPVFKAAIANRVATGGGDSFSFNWDVTADGKKFLLATMATQNDAPQPPVRSC